MLANLDEEVQIELGSLFLFLGKYLDAKQISENCCK